MVILRWELHLIFLLHKLPEEMLFKEILVSLILKGCMSKVRPETMDKVNFTLVNRVLVTVTWKYFKSKNWEFSRDPVIRLSGSYYNGPGFCPLVEEIRFYELWVATKSSKALCNFKLFHIWKVAHLVCLMKFINTCDL